MNKMTSNPDAVQTVSPHPYIAFQINPLPGRTPYPGGRCVDGGRTDIFEMIWIRRGAGRMLVDMTWYPIRENTLFCVAPGQIRRLQATAQAEGYVIASTASFLGEEEAGLSP